jgi:hypothetical protein
VATADDEDDLLRSVALQNAQSILHARQRAEVTRKRDRSDIGNMRRFYPSDLT